MTSEIIFSPQTGVLSASDKEIILTDQGKRCLTYFCLNEGILISKETFTRECWGNRGIVVSDTTVRQTVFRLRRSLSELGLGDDVLQTKGKSGYQLTPGIIALIDVANSATSSEEDDEVIEPAQTVPKSTTKRFTISRLFTRRTGALLLVILLCAGAGFFYRLYGMITHVSYDFSHQEGGRDYFASSLIHANQVEDAISRAAFWLVKEQVPVEESRYVYINGTLGSYIFVMSCTLPIIEKESGCSTLTILGKIHS